MPLPRLVLVPGLLNDADLWRDQISALAPIATPVVADITQGSSLPELVDAVLKVGGDRFALAGFSLGGIVAQQVMQAAPERVSHLALLSTTMLPDTPDRAAKRDRLIALARSPARFHGFGEGILNSYLAPQNARNPQMAERVRAMTARLGPEVFIRQSLLPRPDTRGLLRQITCPTLVMCGALDQITPPKIHRQMAIEMPKSVLKILPDAGHLTPIEAPDAVADALATWLTRSPQN